MNSDTPLHSESIEELRQQVHESRSTIVKVLLMAVGTISVVLGILGIVLPVLPTTPFLLLAAICYSHSSERFYIKLLNNRYFGQYIRDWRENRGLSLAMKLWVVLVLVLSMGVSIAFFIPLLSVKIFCTVTAVVIITYIWSLPTKVDELTHESDQ